jgi:hypothetical protein
MQLGHRLLQLDRDCQSTCRPALHACVLPPATDFCQLSGHCCGPLLKQVQLSREVLYDGRCCVGAPLFVGWQGATGVMGGHSSKCCFACSTWVQPRPGLHPAPILYCCAAAG